MRFKAKPGKITKMHPIIRELEKSFMKQSTDAFRVGDTVDVHVRIREGERERVQIFNGIVIAKNGGGINESFTVRRLVSGEGVERVFPLHTPIVEKIEVKRSGRTARAKLYYLRDRVGKATRLRDETRKSRLLSYSKVVHYEIAKEPEAAAAESTVDNAAEATTPETAATE